MAEASVPVDLLNPGQVFACHGFLTAADVLMSNARGGFDWSDESDIRFRLAADTGDDPVEGVLTFLRDAEVTSRSPRDLGLDTSKWGIDTTQYSSEEPFPFPPPTSPATLAAVLSTTDPSNRFAGKSIEITHWGDSRGETGRDNAKFWGGSAGYPGVAFARNLLEQAKPKIASWMKDPFQLDAEMTSSFRFDWRRDYIDLDIGFSLNKHKKGRFKTVGYPLVELLAAIGMSNARPAFEDKLSYRYGVVGMESQLLDPIFVRASLGCSPLPFPQRLFRMNLSWPGQEGYDRCITTVYEDNSNDNN